jgi:N5-(cytidine 5'-diphosphoramidyl)-L-glutamine hydrolase
MLIKVGVTQRINKIDSYNESRDELDQRLIDWILVAGYIPVPIPNSMMNQNSLKKSKFNLQTWLDELNIGALVLSGGNDIGNELKRDITENFLLDWAEKNNTPVLGICRGMQMLGIWSGIQLCDIQGHIRTRHILDSCDSKSNEWPESVNSYHKKVLKSCPPSFNILATSEDGAIEAIAHKNLSWEGWMWHPEREENFSKLELARFRRLVENAE